jgi:hypothetical protein
VLVLKSRGYDVGLRVQSFDTYLLQLNPQDEHFHSSGRFGRRLSLLFLISSQLLFLESRVLKTVT